MLNINLQSHKKCFAFLLSIFVFAYPCLSAYADIQLDVAHFPDSNFLSWIKENLDTDGNGILSNSEISAVTRISLPAPSTTFSYRKISTLKGLEYFSDLTELYCNGNSLTALDISKNTKLIRLDCYENQITALDVGKNLALEQLYCHRNQLTELDVTKNLALTKLECHENQITSLDVSKNIKLEWLRCGGNQLQKVNVTHNAELTNLYCDNNDLSELDISQNKLLRVLDCAENNLTDLDLSNNAAIQWLFCNSNDLSALDLSKQTVMNWIVCYGNKLATLDLSKNKGFNRGSEANIICKNQVVGGLQITESDGLYKIDLTPFVGSENLTRITSVNNGEYNSSTGIATFSSKPTKVTYNYKVPNQLGSGSSRIVMDVTITESNNTPIIIVPGIMGSRLFMSDTVFNEEMKAWDPIVKKASGETDTERTLKEKIGSFSQLGLLNQRLSLDSTVYVRPYENQNIDSDNQNEGGTIYQYGREYGATDTYKNLVEYLCKEYKFGTDKYRPVYFFSYDWRQSNTDSAEKLHNCIQTVLDDTGADKVDLVCHSMGGLVASKYYTQYGKEQKVNYIITCGTPYEGAPKLLNSVMNWNVLGEGLWRNLEEELEKNLEGADTLKKKFAGIFGGIKGGIIQSASDFFLGCLGYMDKSLKSSFMGVTELLPTENYISRSPMKGIVYDALSFSQYQKICQKIFSGYDSANKFQNDLKDGEYNALLKYDKSYFILGINQKTIAAVKFNYVIDAIDTINGIYNPKLIYVGDLLYNNKGDGTVPYLSSSISEQLKNNFDKERVLEVSTNHTGVVSEEQCLRWIVDKLNQKTSSIQGSKLRSDGYIVLRIACPVDVTISNSDGEELNSSAENFNSISSFGRLDVIGLSDDIKIVCLDNSPNFSIVLNGTDTGTMDYDIRYFNGNDEIYKEESFRDIPVTASTIIKTNTDDSKTTTLELDNDGDGNIDDYVEPDSSYNGDNTDNNNSSSGGGGCEASGSWASITMFAVIIILKRKAIL